MNDVRNAHHYAQMKRTGDQGEAISTPRPPETVAEHFERVQSEPDWTRPVTPMLKMARFPAEAPFEAIALQAGVGAMYLWLCCIAYCEKNGVRAVPEVMVRVFADWQSIGSTAEQIAQRAVDIGLITKTKDGYVLRALP